ncbi:MAG: glycosyl transferase [Candidatus Levybacteria bacterium RIFCSPHIGHO2_02_FULL_37_13]|nr:MAG: glycosyl transferase [Candidatus Levybacteria bacterium RIFCSPHIGHO2_02_FULL_37_13]OGH29492.1 MAG: glycosyl transferase [Candidatus Levybacteria bacterium RIFCSPHIGHO2_12_FULL_37_9]OGH37633.1 MAG: glycosyl transferase [Candidatus Levybacteria bacterium RIFCSPLOWO2_01_FULL_37_26]
MKLSIIIPVFNEEKTILEILKRVISVKIPNVDKEIIIVNDGSTDKTLKLIQDFLLKNPAIKIVSHLENQGKGVAVRTGIDNSSGEYILIQDADLEYDPKYIPLLLNPILQKKAVVVYGTRLKRLPNFRKDERTPQFLLHYMGNKFLSLLTSVLYGQWITDMETCYKLFPRKAVEKINIVAKGFEFEPEITSKLIKYGYKITEVPIKTEPRSYKEGKKLHTIRDGLMTFYSLLKYRLVN